MRRDKRAGRDTRRGHKEPRQRRLSKHSVSFGTGRQGSREPSRVLVAFVLHRENYAQLSLSLYTCQCAAAVPAAKAEAASSRPAVCTQLSSFRLHLLFLSSCAYEFRECNSRSRVSSMVYRIHVRYKATSMCIRAGSV